MPKIIFQQSKKLSGKNKREKKNKSRALTTYDPDPGITGKTGYNKRSGARTGVDGQGGFIKFHGVTGVNFGHFGLQLNAPGADGNVVPIVF